MAYCMAALHLVFAIDLAMLVAIGVCMLMPLPLFLATLFLWLLHLVLTFHEYHHVAIDCIPAFVFQ